MISRRRQGAEEASARLHRWWQTASASEREAYSIARARESLWVRRFLIFWTVLGILLMLAWVAGRRGWLW